MDKYRNAWKSIQQRCKTSKNMGKYHKALKIVEKHGHTSKGVGLLGEALKSMEKHNKASKKVEKRGETSKSMEKHHQVSKAWNNMEIRSIEKHGNSACRMACDYHSLEIRFNMECCKNHLF